MTGIEMIKDMYKRQASYDKLVFDTYCNGEKPLPSDMRLAYVDELGEVTHAYKGEWCWWKKTQKGVNREELLEEIADLIHFAYMIYIEEGHTEKHLETLFYSTLVENFMEVAYPLDSTNIYSQVSNIMSVLSTEKTESIFTIMVPQFLLVETIVLGNWLGFTLEEMHNAYVRKNKINLERVANGY